MSNIWLISDTHFGHESSILINRSEGDANAKKKLYRMRKRDYE